MTNIRLIVPNRFRDARVQIVQFGNGTGALRARIERLLARNMSGRRYLPFRQPTGGGSRPRAALAGRVPNTQCRSG
jgi:hypothetical protein